MKRHLFFSLMLFVSITGIGQTTGDAFYIYRNDGQFNAFFREEVDSIVYSCYDSDSIMYNEYVTQIIHTQDSIYTIPLAAIDSISFVQPEVIFQPNVVKLEGNMMSFLESVNGMSLSFRKDIPEKLLPQKGDVLICTMTDHPLFIDGFVGKVVSVDKRVEINSVICDSIYDLTEIFEQFVSVDKVWNGNDTESFSRRRSEGTWESQQGELSFNLLLARGPLTLSGSLHGNYIATIAYNITKSDQYINLKIHHNWNYGAHLNLSSSTSEYGTIGPVLSLPAIRFPAVAPIFKFQIESSPFIRGKGSVDLDFSLSSPVHSYLTEVTYYNGHFSGSHHRLSVGGSNGPTFEAAMSLSGYVHAGCLVSFSLGTISLLKSHLSTGLDFYIGPKLTGNFSIKGGTELPINTYSLFKDSKLGLSLLTIDFENWGKADFFGIKVLNKKFFEGTIETPLHYDWYFLPAFSDIMVKPDNVNLEVTASSWISRNIVFPLSVGLGLYDNNGTLIQTQYAPNKYRGGQSVLLKSTFSSLTYLKEYTVRPVVGLFNNTLPATPDCQLELQPSPITLEASVEATTAIISGKIPHYEMLGNIDYGIAYLVQGEDNLIYVKANQINVDGSFSVDLSDLQPGTIFDYCAYVITNGGTFYGNRKSFMTEEDNFCPNEQHPHVIDLGLPSGNKWLCCNWGANSPSEYGIYLAWGESTRKEEYTKDNYAWHYIDENGCYVYENATFDLAPSYKDVQELKSKCSVEKYSYHGVSGNVYTGPNGNKIFIPFAGLKKGRETNFVGEDHYWTSTLPSQDKSRKNKILVTRSNNDDEKEEDEGISQAYDWYGLDWRYLGKNVRQVVH